LPVTSARLAGIQAEILSAMNTAVMDRQTRLTIGFMGINGIMWLVLVAGAYVTVAFTYLFGFERTVMQQLMIGGLSLIIGLVLFLTLALDYPFRGSIAVGPEAFRALLADWSSNAAAEPADLQTPVSSK
jgi:glucan phosphoethanolaminetransferase (alkaline phosphatase superfamily)